MAEPIQLVGNAFAWPCAGQESDVNPCSGRVLVTVELPIPAPDISYCPKCGRLYGHFGGPPTLLRTPY